MINLLVSILQADELIKREMLTMLNYDNMKNPVISNSKKAVSLMSQYQSYLDQQPYTEYENIEEAKQLLEKEMDIVREGMAHGDISLENYTTIWEDFLSQILYLEPQKRYTRASLASKKDRIEASERRLEQNRIHMTGEAKRAAKMEKKLKILTGGYQVNTKFNS